MTTAVSLPQSGSPLVSQIVEQFTHFVKGLNGRGQSPVSTIRLRAIEEFQRLGIPTVRHEEWKYTNLFPLLAKQFIPASSDIPTGELDALISSLGRWGQVVPIINGVLTSEQPPYVRSLEATLTGEHSLSEQLGLLARFEGNAVVAWNTAFLQDGAVIVVPDNVVLNEPIVLASVIAAFQSNTLVHERHLIQLGRNSIATLVFVQRGIGEHDVLLNQVVEAWVGEGAKLTVLLVQDDDPTTHALTTHEFALSSNSQLHLVTISIGGGFIRNMPAARLLGDGADVQLYGLTIADGEMLVDHHTVVDHQVPHCTSNQLYKAIFDGRSTGVFNGKILVRPHAQKTSAYQANRNIVLSSRATINTKPQLEIFANDVRCTHGCTVGRLDAEAMFYLRSRGLSKAEAEALLLSAFAEEITAQIPSTAIRSDVNSRIEHLLHADELA